VNKLPAVRIMRRLLLLGALLPMMSPALAGGPPLSAVAPAHGPMLMMYVSQPLWGRGASRVYGLRLQQIALQPFVQSGTFSAIAPPRALIDLQWRRQAEVRVQFGTHVTWDMRRGEFELSGYQHGMSADLIAIPR
jgi:hypothetical protein